MAGLAMEWMMLHQSHTPCQCLDKPTTSLDLKCESSIFSYATHTGLVAPWVKLDHPTKNAHYISQNVSNTTSINTNHTMGIMVSAWGDQTCYACV